MGRAARAWHLRRCSTATEGAPPCRNNLVILTRAGPSPPSSRIANDRRGDRDESIEVARYWACSRRRTPTLCALDGGRTTRATCLHPGQAERWQWAPRRALGAHRRAIG